MSDPSLSSRSLFLVIPPAEHRFEIVEQELGPHSSFKAALLHPTHLRCLAFHSAAFSTSSSSFCDVADTVRSRKSTSRSGKVGNLWYPKVCDATPPILRASSTAIIEKKRKWKKIRNLAWAGGVEQARHVAVFFLFFFSFLQVSSFATRVVGGRMCR
ncbi:hypothetical protein BGZ63DRAFT_19904 [Mariannaea sp. PMI_226]|nr:hypothetical protein BGZ63DRAFT_19904 [Mariannaea sp. PMI_226]